MRFYQKTWFSISLTLASVIVGLALRRLGLVDDGKYFVMFAFALLVFVLMTLTYPRICPWVHRRLRIAFRLDDPEQRRKAGLPPS